MATIETQKLLTAEEFGRLPETGRRHELVRGRIVEMNMPFPRHGQVCITIGAIVHNYARQKKAGHVVGNDAGVITERGPDTVRGADVAFYSYARVPEGPLPIRYLEVPPDVVFEVLSPSDRRPKTMAKVAEYLEAGVRVVAVVDPERESISLERPEGPPVILGAADELVIPEIGPDFRVAVREIFE